MDEMLFYTQLHQRHSLAVISSVLATAPPGPLLNVVVEAMMARLAGLSLWEILLKDRLATGNDLEQQTMMYNMIRKADQTNGFGRQPEKAHDFARQMIEAHERRVKRERHGGSVQPINVQHDVDPCFGPGLSSQIVTLIAPLMEEDVPSLADRMSWDEEHVAPNGVTLIELLAYLHGLYQTTDLDRMLEAATFFKDDISAEAQTLRSRRVN